MCIAINVEPNTVSVEDIFDGENNIEVGRNQLLDKVEAFYLTPDRETTDVVDPAQTTELKNLLDYNKLTYKEGISNIRVVERV